MALVEIARYRLREGADDAVLVAAEKEIQATIGPTHPGYVDRALLRSADGEYVLVMRWADQAAADSWNATLFASEAGRQLGGLVDPTTMRKETLTSVAP